MKKLFLLFLAFVSVSFSQTGYIKDWLVLGSFPNPDASTRLSMDYVNGESSLIPHGGEVLAGHQWIMYRSAANGIDFVGADTSLFAFAEYEKCVVYAACFVRSPKDQTVHLLVGSDDGVAVWCNVQRVHFNDANRGVVLDNDTVAVTLRDGWNTLLFKVANELGGYGLSARFGDGEGLIVQADCPFPSSALLTPATIECPPATPEFRFALTEKNQAVLSFNLSLLNRGSSLGKDVAVTTYAGDVIFNQVHIPEIHGGEVVRIPEQIPFSQAVIFDENEMPLNLCTDLNGKRTQLTYGYAGRVLKKIFEPWELEGWKETVHDTVASLSRTVVVPYDLAGLGLDFMVDIGDRWGKVLVNGEEQLPLFSGDSGDLTLTTKAAANDTFRIEVIAKTSNPIQGKVLSASYLRIHNKPLERYTYDSRFAGDMYNADLGDQSATRKKLLSLFQTHHLEQAEDVLKEFNHKLAPFSAEAKQLTLHFIGNAHIDLAWLWRYTETIDVVRRTFQAAIDNLKMYPDFKFSHGQAQSYFWMEEKYPELFREIQKYVTEGRWEIVGGTWAESDANMPSGESLVRQYLYGKRYFRNKFGVDVKHGWHPDTFGHPESLPQILAKCGIETYTFFRPWKDERMFQWESPDGSRVFAHRPPNWYGTWSPIPDTIWKTVTGAQKKFGVTADAQFYGVGDHGGGPTRRQINMIRELGSLNVYPEVKLSTFDAFYKDLLSQKKNPPVQRGEQNSVFEGCYTSQAMVKSNNRKAEALLPTAEVFSSIATQFGYPYPSEKFEEAWHRVLFNQFHDVLCGSGIHDVYADVQQMYDEAFQRANQAMDGALSVIAKNVATNNKTKSAAPILVFNPLNWKRSDPVEFTWRMHDAHMVPKIADEKGKEIPSQVIGRWTDSARVVFLPGEVPSVGYKTYWITSKKEASSRSSGKLALANRFFRVEVDKASGSVSRIYDVVHKREVIQVGRLANQLQIQDDDAGMSAWVIGLKGVPYSIDSPTSVRVVEDGMVRKVIRAEYRLESSSFTQDVIVYSDLPRIDFKVSADWHHRKKILKIAFPLNVDHPRAAFDIPYGTIERDTVNGKEVVTQKWTDLSGSDFGVSLLNDSKYGCDVRENVVRLTALRAPTDPDPKADEGHHEFSYALYPHAGSWQEAMTVQRGYEFNTPLVTRAVEQHKGALPSSLSFLKIDAPSIVLTTIKKCEDDGRLIVRCYETTGKSVESRFRFWMPLEDATETDLMEYGEATLGNVQTAGGVVTLAVHPYEIRTMKIRFAPGMK